MVINPLPKELLRNRIFRRRRFNVFQNISQSFAVCVSVTVPWRLQIYGLSDNFLYVFNFLLCPPELSGQFVRSWGAAMLLHQNKSSALQLPYFLCSAGGDADGAPLIYGGAVYGLVYPPSCVG